MLNEIECISELRRGSYKAFKLVYDEYSDRLYGFALSQLHNRMLAQDIVQDTFMRLWINRHKLNCFGNLQGLIYAIAKYRILDHFRQQMASPEFVEYMAEISSHNNDISPEDILIYNEFRSRLAKAKTKLTPRMLEIYDLSRERGMKISEIANMLGISEQTVKNQLHSALRILRSELLNFALIFTILS